MLQRAESKTQAMDRIITSVEPEMTPPPKNPREPDVPSVDWARVSDEDTVVIVSALEETFRQNNWPVPTGKPRSFIPYEKPRNKNELHQP